MQRKPGMACHERKTEPQTRSFHRPWTGVPGALSSRAIRLKECQAQVVAMNRANLVRWGAWGGALVAIGATVTACASGATVQQGLSQLAEQGIDSGVIHLDSGVVVLGDSGSGGCASGESACSSVCVDLTTDPLNCGQCSMVCTVGQTCVASSCTTTSTGGMDSGGGGTDSGSGGGDTGSTSCPGTESNCSGICTDTTSDPDNCGGCGFPCVSGESCVSSNCTGGGTPDAGSGGGPCAHSPCQTGAALPDGCDDSLDGMVSFVCDDVGDTACCSSSWSAQCVSEAEEYCSILGGCFDPDC